MRDIDAGVAYCRGRLKRLFDVVVSLGLLLTTAPLLVLIAVMVAIAMGAPVLFTQERVGLNGRLFRVLKFRSMKTSARKGLAVTSSDDSRVTPMGRLLRVTKLDELPQFINVLRGEMSIVGPRPEVPCYVECYSDEQRQILSVKPGLTDPATLAFRHEEALLASIAEAERDTYYTQQVLPQKLAINLEYLAYAGFWYDLKLAFRTVGAILSVRGT